jgi:hypothetical protein
MEKEENVKAETSILTFEFDEKARCLNSLCSCRDDDDFVDLKRMQIQLGFQLWL